MQSGARNAIRFTKNNKEISEEERKEDIEIYQDQLEALNIAIQELEQQPCDDCVSRAELKKWHDMNFSFGGALRKLEMFDRIDKELPPVTPTFSKGTTNGDMIKAMFPSASETDHCILDSPIGKIIYIRLEEYQEMRVQQEWWNAPYKRK